MIYSHIGQFAFVHIHKCGGESIEFAFDQISKPSDFILGGTEWSERLQKRYVERFKLRKHSVSDRIADSFQGLITPHFHFYVLLRDPIDRAISTFYYFKKWGYDLAKPFDNPSDFWLSDKVNWHGPDFFFLAQHKFLPLKHKSINTKIYLLEDIALMVDDMNKLLTPLGYEEMAALHRNSGNYQQKVGLNEKAKLYIQNRYSEDFKLIASIKHDK